MENIIPDDNLVDKNEEESHMNTEGKEVYTKSCRYPFIHKPGIERKINDMLNQGIIHPSQLLSFSSIWIVPERRTLLENRF